MGGGWLLVVALVFLAAGRRCHPFAFSLFYGVLGSIFREKVLNRRDTGRI